MSAHAPTTGDERPVVICDRCQTPIPRHEKIEKIPTRTGEEPYCRACRAEVFV